MNNWLRNQPSHVSPSPNKPYDLDKPPKCNQGDKPDKAWTLKTCTYGSAMPRPSVAPEVRPGFQALGLLRSLAYLTLQGPCRFRIFRKKRWFCPGWVASFPSRVVKSRSAARAAVAPGLDQNILRNSIEHDRAIESYCCTNWDAAEAKARYPSPALQFCRPVNQR